MAGKKTGKRLLTWVLVLVMALSLLPLNALADELDMAGDPDTSRTQSTGENGAYLVKSATKDGDTYQIQLESLVTGKVTPTTESAPLDIVLVLDQSGSMEGEKLSNLKAAVTNFVAAINADADAHNVEHRIAIVGFASNQTEGGSNWGEDGAWYNTGIFVNGTLKNYQTYRGEGQWENVYLTGDSRPEADYEYRIRVGREYFGYYQSIEYDAEKKEWGYWSGLFGNRWNPITPRTDENDNSPEHVQVQYRAKAGYIDLTKADYQAALVDSDHSDITTAIRNLSASGATRASYGMEMANNVFANNDLRDGSSRVVVFFTDGEPGQDGYETDEAGRAIAQAYATKHTHDAKVFSVGMFDDPSDKVKNFMNYVSSNYPDANASEPSYIWDDWTITSGTKDADKYYMTVENGDLSAVFKTISGSILTPNVKADANTVLTDTLSQYFDFDGVTVENGTVTGVTVKKVAYHGDGIWASDVEDITEKVTVGLNGKTVTVSGFDYSNNDNVVTDGTNASGYKLVVTFNVKPDTSYTNWGASDKYPTNSGKATLAKVGEDPFATVDSPNAYVETYQVAYQPGEGSGTAYADQYYPNGATTKVKASDTFTAPNGYEFDCWKDESGKTYQLNDPITFNKSDVTLTAQWREIEAPELSVTKTVTKVGETTVAANRTIPTAYPGDEIEWTITVTNSGNAAGDFTLKETLSDITVKDAEGNAVTLSNNNEWSGTVEANDSVSYTVTYTVEDADVTNNSLVNTVTMNGTSEESSDPVPTAQKYTVTYALTNNVKPTNYSEPIDNNKYTKDQEYTVDSTHKANDQVVEGGYTYTFSGWKLNGTGDVLTGTQTMGNESVVLKGTWTRTVNKYTVTYTDGVDGEEVFADQTYNVPFEDTITAFNGTPTRTGYTFTSWAWYKVEGGNDVKIAEPHTMPAYDLKAVAQWTADPIAVDLSQYVYKQYVQKYNRKDTTTFNFTAEVYPKAEISSGSGSAVVLANPLIDTVKGEVKIDSSKNGEVKQVTFEKTDKLSAGWYYVYITENKGTNSYITYDNSGYGLNIRVFDNGKTGLEVNLIGIDKVKENGQMETTSDTTVTFVNTYTRAYHSSVTTPSKPTLNTGDHYAYVMGYPDGTVRPNGSITRAEVSTILFRLLSDKTRDEYFTTESSFTDVKAGAWYNNSIATLEKAGVIVDTAKGGAFRPNEAITRAELAAMLAQFSDAKPVKGVKFSDVPAEHWAYEAIAIAAKMGWIEGYPDGTFRPDATITRAEMMTLVNRALERVPSDEDHLLSKRVMLTFPDCKSGDWFYIAVQEATNSHTYERAATEKNGDEQWSALRANRDWTQLEK